MTNIGPNFRPPNQPPQTAPAQAGEKSAQSANNPQANDSRNANAASSQAGAPVQASLLAHQNALGPEQLVLLLKNLLRMPQEIAQFLAMFTSLDAQLGQELLQQLLTENPPVALEELQQFLQGHMDKAQDKLLKLLQSSQMGVTGSGKQMGELMGGLAELVAQTEKSPTQALHTAISLYLPYYPLHPPQAFTFRFETPPESEGEGGADGSPSEPQLTVFITTLTLGLFKITLFTEPQAPLQIVVEHDAVVTPYAELIQRDVNEGLGPNILQKPQWLWTPRKSAPSGIGAGELKSATPGAGKASEQSVGIQPAGGVCVMTLQVAYLLIRVILQMDNRLGLSGES